MSYRDAMHLKSSKYVNDEFVYKIFWQADSPLKSLERSLTVEIEWVDKFQYKH